jgi:hypothetical protein
MGFQHQAKCDECGERFRPQVVTEPWGDGGERVYFDCPACGQRYIVAIANKTAVTARANAKLVRERLRALRGEPPTAATVAARTLLLEELEGLQQTIDRNVVVKEPA